MRRLALIVCLYTVALLAGGCGKSLLSLNIFVVDEQTALERQVLGSYEEIGRDLATFASVRGVNPDGSLKEPPMVTDSQRGAARAMSNRRYNRDDIDALLEAGVLGEGIDGLLVRHADEVPQALGINPALVPTLLDEENADRRAILDRLMQTTPGVREADRDKVAAILARLNQEAAPAGAPIQGADGAWSVKQ